MNDTSNKQLFGVGDDVFRLHLTTKRVKEGPKPYLNTRIYQSQFNLGQ